MKTTAILSTLLLIASAIYPAAARDWECILRTCSGDAPHTSCSSEQLTGGNVYFCDSTFNPDWSGSLCAASKTDAINLVNTFCLSGGNGYGLGRIYNKDSWLFPNH